LLHLLDRVTLGHVADLVPQHSGNLAHGPGALDEAAIDVDESAGHRERVDLAGVDNEKLPIEVAIIGERRDGIPQPVDVAGEDRIRDQWQLLVDLTGIVRAHLDLLLGRYRSTSGHRNKQRGRGKTSHWYSCASREGSRHLGKTYSTPGR
jgi:hypothetical protein